MTTPKAAFADIGVYDAESVTSLLSEVNELGDKFLRAKAEENRLELAHAVRKLSLALETPRETLIRHDTGDPSSILALTAGYEAGVWKYLDQHDDPFVATEVGQAVGADPELIARFMRHLAASGYLNEVSPDRYTRTHFTKAMAVNVIGECYPAFAAYAAPAYANFPAYGQKTKWQTPMNPNDGNYQMAMKTPLNYLEYIQAKPDGYRFALHMQAYNQGRPAWMDPGFYPIEESLVKGFDPSNDAVFLVDIGGSSGHDLEELIRKHPSIPGRLVLQDLPVVLQNVKDLNKRIEPMEYDFNNKQPIKGARAYYLHSILHDWPDDICIKILKNIIPGMTEGYSKILINDSVIPREGANWEATGHDIAMLTMLSALERTQERWEKLIAEAGLKLVKIWTPGLVNGQSVLECEL